MEINGVILNELLHVAMAPAGVEVILLHLRRDLIVIPVVMIESVHSAHNARAVTSASAVNKKLSGCRIVNQLQEQVNLCSFRIVFVAHRDVDVFHSESFNSLLFIRCTVILQVDDWLNTERS